MLIFTQQISPRLQHMANWLGNYLFGKPMQIITEANTLSATDDVLNYTNETLPFPCFQLQPHRLLFETEILSQTIDIKLADNTPYFFETGGDFPFDLLAASFYLLQRYEEYLPHEKDMYGRYAHTNSVAFTNQFLHLPLADLWMMQFKQKLQSFFPNIQFIERKFQYLPTYDVDIAYSFRGKGILRNIGGLYRSLLTRQMDDFMQRMEFLTAGKEDPFNVFAELNTMHQQYELKPIYFFLLAQKQQGIDKNIHPRKKVYRQLIQKLAAQYQTGIHFSGAASESFNEMTAEKKLLSSITNTQITANRMHYILLHLPETYQQLLQQNITADYSMGYGSINGFRASTCTPYLWYDLANETSTSLQVFPFCYMEANSIFEQLNTPEEALNEMKHYLQIIRQLEGCYITIFHNHLIGCSENGRPWMNLYKQFLATLADQNIMPQPSTAK